MFVAFSSVLHCPLRFYLSWTIIKQNEWSHTVINLIHKWNGKHIKYKPSWFSSPSILSLMFVAFSSALHCPLRFYLSWTIIKQNEWSHTVINLIHKWNGKTQIQTFVIFFAIDPSFDVRCFFLGAPLPTSLLHVLDYHKAKWVKSYCNQLDS
jgi:hypothetical protein